MHDYANITAFIVAITPPQPGDIPPQVVEVAEAFFMMVAVIALGIPIIRVFARRFERGPLNPSLPTELTTRLERIEQGVEAMAIEIERISEGQRFTTKLLAEQRQLGKTGGSGADPNASRGANGGS